MTPKRFSCAREFILLTCIALPVVAQASPVVVTFDLSSLNGATFELEIALYDNSGIIGDTWVLIDNVAFGPQGANFEDGTTGGFDPSLNPGSVNVVNGSLNGTGSFVLRIDEDPGVTPTLTFKDFNASNDALLSVMYDIAASVTVGHFGLDQLVLSILDPVTLEPLIPGITVNFGDILAADANGMKYKKKCTLSISSTEGGSVTTPGEGAFEYIQYDDPAHTTVPITATPEQYHHFVKWMGSAVDAGKVTDPCAASTFVLVDADYTLCGVFAIDRHTVSLSSSAGGHIVSPRNGDQIFDGGTRIELAAEATDPLFQFIEWTGTYGSPEISPSLLIDQDHRIRAQFVSLRNTLYVDANGPEDPSPYDADTSDPNENGTREHPFDSIQEAIEVAGAAATIIVRSGTYRENIDFLGKNITVTGFDPNDSEKCHEFPIIHGAYQGTVVTFCHNEDPNATLSGFVITGGRGYLAGGVCCRNSHPTIVNCLIVGNRSTGHSCGGGAVFCEKSNATFSNCTMADNFGGGTEGAGFYTTDGCPVVQNSILCGNLPVEIAHGIHSPPVLSYCDVFGGWSGETSLMADPLFKCPGHWANRWDAQPALDLSFAAAVWIDGDYHLQSGSQCIDAGDPGVPCAGEPQPNGDRIDLGAYGGTCHTISSQ